MTSNSRRQPWSAGRPCSLFRPDGPGRSTWFGTYTVVLSNGCDSVTTAAAVATITPAVCPADIGRDGVVVRASGPAPPPPAAGPPPGREGAGAARTSALASAQALQAGRVRGVESSLRTPAVLPNKPSPHCSNRPKRTVSPQTAVSEDAGSERRHQLFCFNGCGSQMYTQQIR